MRYIHPSAGLDIRAWRGVDCYISYWAFGDASVKYAVNIVPRLLFYPNSRQLRGQYRHRKNIYHESSINFLL